MTYVSFNPISSPDCGIEYSTKPIGFFTGPMPGVLVSSTHSIGAGVVDDGAGIAIINKYQHTQKKRFVIQNK